MSSSNIIQYAETKERLELEQASLIKQTKAVWAVFFAAIIAFMGIGLVDPILPAIANSLNATPSEVTLLFTSYNAVMAVAMLITGTISSRIGMKWTLLSGIILIAVFSALGGLAGNVWTIIGLRGGWGLGNALFVATALSAIVTLSGTGTARAVILYEAAVGLGISVGPLVGGWLGAVSWRGPFLGVASLMVIAFIGLSTLMPNSSASTGSKASRTSLAAQIDGSDAVPLRTDDACDGHLDEPSMGDYHSCHCRRGSAGEQQYTDHNSRYERGTC